MGRMQDMRVFKLPPHPLTYEERHPYLLTLPGGEQMRFSNWPTAIVTALDRRAESITFEGLKVFPMKRHRDAPEFPRFEAVAVQI